MMVLSSVQTGPRGFRGLRPDVRPPGGAGLCNDAVNVVTHNWISRTFFFKIFFYSFPKQGAFPVPPLRLRGRGHPRRSPVRPALGQDDALPLVG